MNNDVFINLGLSEDPFKTLGLLNNDNDPNYMASDNEIKRAYRAKVISAHPDKKPVGDKAAFGVLTSAYQYLTDFTTWQKGRLEYFCSIIEKEKFKDGVGSVKIQFYPISDPLFYSILRCCFE